MSNHEPNPKLARALAGDVEEPDRDVPCMKCGKPTLCPGFLIASVKLWNHDEKDCAERANRRYEFIAWDEILPCDDCALVVRAEKREEYQLECATTAIYLRELLQGKYNPESLAWLRGHGHAAEVHRKLSEGGTSGE